MTQPRYEQIGSSALSPIDNTRRKEIVLKQPVADCQLFYHYGDLDRTPVRNVSYLATLCDGTTRSGQLDADGRATLSGIPFGPVKVQYQHDTPDDDDAAIVAGREEVRKALDAIVAQTRIDMADEWKEWNEAGWLKRHYLLKVNEWQGTAVGGWEWLSGTVQAVWQLAVLLYKTDKEIRTIRNLVLTGQWNALDEKIADYRAQGEKVLDKASEIKELLILIFHDQKTREIIQAFPGQWWAAIPPDERRELEASVGTQIAIDIVIAVLLAAFTAGTAGAAYGGAKWTQRIGKLGTKVVELLDKLKDAFQNLAKALKARKRKTVDVQRPNAERRIETEWRTMALKRLFPLKLKALERRWVGEHLPDNKQWDWLRPPGQVKYLSSAEREQYKLTIRDGKLYGADGNLYDTSKAMSIHSDDAGKAIFVMDKDGSIYAGSHEKGKFHHSSFLAGKPVAAAGEIEVRGGVIRSISDKSGHYRPTREFLDQSLNVLEAQGIKTSTITRLSW